MNKILTIRMNAVIIKIVLGLVILLAFSLTGCTKTPTQVTVTSNSYTVDFEDVNTELTFYYADEGNVSKVKIDNHNKSESDSKGERPTSDYKWLDVFHERVGGNSSKIINTEFQRGDEIRATIVCEEVTRIVRFTLE
ncbi:MAG: hypothetical protein WC499_01210 [Patescibacteria group bacterium]